MAPVDRIRKALGPEKSAAFDLLLAAYAARVEEIVATHGSAGPAIRSRFHRGNLVELALERDEKFL